jgi:pSer/pThr/pTyr-binding forkhead associated (FHA) protein
MSLHGTMVRPCADSPSIAASSSSVLADNGSTNGTYAGDQRVDRIEINGECQVRLGHPADGPVLVCTVSGSDPDAGRHSTRVDISAVGEDGATTPSGPHMQPEPVPLSGEPVPPSPEPSVVRPLPSRVLRIGRAPDNDIVVADPAVSSHHAELRNVAGVYRIVDLGSTNGTFVNGQRVTDAALSEGDVVGVGSSTLRLAGQELQEFAGTGALVEGTPPPVAVPPGDGNRSLQADDAGDAAQEPAPRDRSVSSIMRRMSSGSQRGATPRRGGVSQGSAGQSRAQSRVLLVPTILTNVVGMDTAEARTLVCRELLTNGSPKRTRHLEVSLPPGVSYRVGDHLGDGVAHVTVGLETTPVPGMPDREFCGMSSHYVHTLREGDRLNVFHDSADGFYLQEDVTKPMIFVSIGTGFAAMRAFLWERVALKRAGDSLAEAALFNGIRSSSVDYIYRD